ncbi:hypothetical protein BGX21_003421 [Mortierella sp. AD011]|nr:hypothetical protein BGX20_008173 [Mortierella sp. AD010]KAF9400825.1 hypothetical protein BGX21_003421 [Mortierella sp. AD011]
MAEQAQTHVPTVPLEETAVITENNTIHSSASSTTPVHQFDTIDDGSSDDDTSNDSPLRSIKRSLPQLFVFPHLFRKHAWALLILTTVVMITYIWLYLGSLWSPLTRVKNFNVVLYNGDTGFDYSNTPAQLVPLFQAITSNSSLGSLVEKQIMNHQGALNHVVTWIDRTNEGNLDRDALLNMIEVGDAWGVIYIPSNFSNNMLSYAPTNSGPATAASLKPVQFEYIYDQGRAYGTHSILEKVISKSMSALTMGFESGLLNSSANQTLLQTMHPSFWLQAMSMSETIMHPVLIYGQSFACYITFVVLYIGAILTVTTTTKFLPNTVETLGVLDNIDGSGKPSTTKFPAIRIAWARHAVGFIFSTFHVIFIWMVPQVMSSHQIYEKYNAGIAFAFIWLVGKSFNSILFLFVQLLTVDGFQIPATLFMILMLTSSGGILDWRVMPGFFRIGKAFPFTYAVNGMKAIYFGSRTDKMWVNWVAIAAWTVVPLTIHIVLARSDVRLRREALRQQSRTKSAASSEL